MNDPTQWPPTQETIAQIILLFVLAFLRQALTKDFNFWIPQSAGHGATIFFLFWMIESQEGIFSSVLYFSIISAFMMVPFCLNGGQKEKYVPQLTFGLGEFFMGYLDYIACTIFFTTDSVMIRMKVFGILAVLNGFWYLIYQRVQKRDKLSQLETRLLEKPVELMIQKQ